MCLSISSGINIEKSNEYRITEMMGNRGNRVGERWNEMACEEKSSVIQEEIKRVNKLPSNSVYAVHRLKVLNKINHLLSVQRTLSQEKDLELLFTQLSL